MEPHVPEEGLFRMCRHCSFPIARVLAPKCICKRVAYCDEWCQSRQWPSHRRVCHWYGRAHRAPAARDALLSWVGDSRGRYQHDHHRVCRVTSPMFLMASLSAASRPRRRQIVATPTPRPRLRRHHRPGPNIALHINILELQIETTKSYPI